jgi:hypothetical protein
MYLWSVWYSLADIVYRSAFRRTGSVVDLAVTLFRAGFAPSGVGVAINEQRAHICRRNVVGA